MQSIDQRFEEFHSANPGIYVELVRLARLAKARGRKHCGVKWLWEVIRWNHFIATGQEYRLNNIFTSRYSREIMTREPDLQGFFETRVLKSGDHHDPEDEYDFTSPDLD